MTTQADLDRLARSIKRAGGTITAGLSSSGVAVTVNSQGIAETAFAFAAVTKEMLRKSQGEVLATGNAMIRRGEELFRERLEHPEVSSTAGVGYRRQDRETGNFRFGRGKAFTYSQKRLDRQNGVAVLGWPNVEQADRITNGIWRYLETGLPASLHLRPTFVWQTTPQYNPTAARTVGGRAVSEPGGIYPHPVSKNLRQGPGFEGKYFLRDAFEQVLNERDPAGKIQRIIGEEFSRIN